MAQFFLYLFRSVAGTTQSQDRVLFAYTKSYNRDAWTLNNKPETNTNISLMLWWLRWATLRRRTLSQISANKKRIPDLFSRPDLYISFPACLSSDNNWECPAAASSFAPQENNKQKETVATAWVPEQLQRVLRRTWSWLIRNDFWYLFFLKIGQMMPNELLVTLVNSNMHHESSW